MIESGYPDFRIASWFGVLVPANTPQAVVDVLDQEFMRIMGLEDVRARLQNAGLEPVSDTASAMLARSRRERPVWGEVIQKSGMKID
jgi:tripartite-type tricarboxylate transporter receptor subunit TctC